MRFCSDCGFKVERLKAPDSWTSRYRCTHEDCGKRYETYYGDAMGGSVDVHDVRLDPWPNEEVCE